MPETPYAYIIPQWKDKQSHPAYANIAGALRAEGYELAAHDPKWLSGKVEAWTSALLRTAQEQPTMPIVCAYGIGSMIALMASASKPIERLILCSPRGYFKEYTTQPGFIPERWMGDPRLEEFSRLSADDLLGKIHVGSGIIIIDESELIARPLHRQWIDDLLARTSWECVRLPRQSYGFGSPGYLDAIKGVVKKMHSNEASPASLM